MYMHKGAVIVSHWFHFWFVKGQHLIHERYIEFALSKYQPILLWTLRVKRSCQCEYHSGTTYGLPSLVYPLGTLSIQGRCHDLDTFVGASSRPYRSRIIMNVQQDLML